ncbi:MAG: hypothetical protein WCP69_15850 [Bacteroidota bacterium]
MNNYLIYHPSRVKTVIGNMTVYHDKFGSNEDPYIWNDKFIHTYCHITQLSNDKGQINFWVSGDKYPNFTHLYCDCVFVIAEKLYWDENNKIDRSDSIVDNDQTFEHNYKWANTGNHLLLRRRRYTLKGDRNKSFQPQDKDKNLIDILPFLNQNGFKTTDLIKSMTSKRGSRPFKFDSIFGQKLYEYLFSKAAIKHYGKQLKNKHPNRKTITSTTTCGHC